MLNSSSIKKYFTSNSLIFALMLLMVSLAIIYFQSDQTDGSKNKHARDVAGAGKNLTTIDLTDEELVKLIKNKYSLAAYKEELIGLEAQLKENYEKADLVERVALERELLLVRIRMADAEKSYEGKLELCKELIRFLTDSRNDFTDEDYNLTIKMLRTGNITSASKLLAQIHEKYSVTLGGESLDRAANAIFLMGKIANAQMRYQRTYHYYRQAVRNDPENTLYLLAAAEAASNIALYRKATIYYEAALHILQNNPDTPAEKIRQLLFKVAEVWESRSDMKKAKEYYRQAEQLSVTPPG